MEILVCLVPLFNLILFNFILSYRNKDNGNWDSVEYNDDGTIRKAIWKRKE